MLGNLRSNALRHTPAVGRVDVEVTPNDASVSFEVTDNGDGIAAEHVDRILERFYRVDTARDPEHGGTEWVWQ